jgi:hypothetical protein
MEHVGYALTCSSTNFDTLGLSRQAACPAQLWCSHSRMLVEACIRVVCRIQRAPTEGEPYCREAGGDLFSMQGVTQMAAARVFARWVAPTAAAKTTMLNCLVAAAPAREHVATYEEVFDVR